VQEPYRSPDWALVPAKPAQGLNTNQSTNIYIVYIYIQYVPLKIFIEKISVFNKNGNNKHSKVRIVLGFRPTASVNFEDFTF
jgi:hypothetical protein